MKKLLFLPVFMIIFTVTARGQVIKDSGSLILFHGVVVDAGSYAPLTNTQIFLNKAFIAVSDGKGKFAFYANRGDTIVFRSLGYKQAIMNISDTLRGKEFLAGIFMNADTVEIAEVVILPRMATLRSDLMRPPALATREMENAKYNMAISAYQGRVNQGRLGDPSMNYEMIRQKQREDAYSRGQIPPDKIVGLSPLLLIPAAYLLINGLPEKPSAVKPTVTDQEVENIIEKYRGSLSPYKRLP
ncbi:MAG: carboxypeptidase-like regulatory domain-containing protein [Bacteroidales bacterium]|jgi:hypothetical protein|nr:carboxypeptidase-like regulatory domain-containing protein [Bacteroidales bacterium]